MSAWCAGNSFNQVSTYNTEEHIFLNSVIAEIVINILYNFTCSYVIQVIELNMYDPDIAPLL